MCMGDKSELFQYFSNKKGIKLFIFPHNSGSLRKQLKDIHIMLISDTLWQSQNRRLLSVKDGIH